MSTHPISRTARRLGVGLTVALIVGLGGGLAPAHATDASGSTATRTDPRTLPRDQRPAPQQPTVDAKASDHGVRVMWHHAPDNARTFIVSRSGGGTDVVLTDPPVVGQTFLDKTAEPGVAYTYTVAVAGVAPAGKAKASAARTTGTVGETLGAADATAPATHTHAAPKAHASKAKAGAKKHGPSTTTRPNAAKTLAARPMVTPKITNAANCQFGGTLTGTNSWSTTSQTVNGVTTAVACPDGVEITADVIIPSGASLTIAPGTTVYVDIAPVADGTGITDAYDIIARGTLNAVGTATSRITITSINASAQDSAAPPASGDWGDLFYDGTAGNNPAGSLKFATVQYGDRVIADRYALPISDDTIDNMAASGPYGDYWAGLDYVHVPANATVSIARLTYNGEADDSGVGITSYEDNDFNGDAFHGNGMTVSITDSQITGYYAVWAEDDSYDANARVAITATGNTFSATGGSEGLGVEVDQNHNAAPGGVTT